MRQRRIKGLQAECLHSDESRMRVGDEEQWRPREMSRYIPSLVEEMRRVLLAGYLVCEQTLPMMIRIPKSPGRTHSFLH